MIDRLKEALADRYALLEELGEGGMATVYLAKDLKHNRSVALKVLKPELAAVVGGERFLAEIETTANLSHPHILPLHDSGEADSFLYYVMPYVEGDSLRDKLDRERQLSVDEAVRIARDLAEALDYAHRHEVIHRDIKPANIMIQDGRPLIADFGIALAVGSAGGARLTETGLSVGTPYYMSPEQATGDSMVGPATDIYALACVLYEMLVGEPPFPGATAQAVLGKIIAGGAVSATEARPNIPAHVDAAIRKALEKLPADRFASAKHFAEALGDPGFRHGVSSAVDEAALGTWKKRAYTFAGAAVVMAATTAWALLAPTEAPPGDILRVAVSLPESQAAVPGSNFDVSDDGRFFVYRGPGPEPGTTQLYLRLADALEATPIPDTEGGIAPSISPDGERLAVQVDGELRVIPLGGGVTRTISESVQNGATWSADGASLYFEPSSELPQGLIRVPVAGGEPVRVTRPDSAAGHVSHAWPDYLPDGRHMLVEVLTDEADSIGIADLETGEVRVLFEGEFPRYSSSGHLLYAAPGEQTSQLLAVPFDADRVEVTGDPVPLTGELASTGGFHAYAVSHTGRLLLGLATDEMETLGQLTPVWLDREGSMQVVDPDWLFFPGANNRGIEISPDGNRVAVNRVDIDGQEDIWVKQLPGGTFSPVTREPGEDVRPKWSEDGRSILYVSRRGSDDANSNADVWMRRADGVGEPELVLDYRTNIWEVEVAPGGDWVVARVGGQVNQAGARDIVIRGPDDEEARPVLDSDFDEKSIDLSPDGRWLAYESDDTGQNQVYVRPFPNVDDGRYPVSQRGGTMPKWAHGSNELFFVNGDREMVAATFTTEGGDFRVTELDVLFELPPSIFYNATEQYALYDVDVDDQRFIWMRTLTDELPFALVLVDHWAADLIDGGS
jgi:serine/threonine-protein kinase